ncbi:monovalent cation/H+ antiporter subunit D [Phytohalomonas tamaricis]|uniref:monovalent cation/H+ antiporter subunit D n=1 Tax=Phytohalomonas tamaricis TaxID=2081032 RepID=UPI000D0AC742|nr:monovalent cation/H+ antiporter subunit D [Phytohalomonas tamaricis]
MSQHLLIFPIILPLVAGLLLLWQRQGAVLVKRVVGISATTLLVIVGIAMVITADDDTIRYYALGNWQPPFGIILVLDRLSAIMVLTTALLALASVIYASAGQDEEGSNFHGLFQLQLMGINGAFMTGDLFNLFVFFEVLLIASYALLMHGGGKGRTQAGVHYVVLNVAGSSLFLFGLGVLYGTLGSLNMADMAVRVQYLDATQAGLTLAGALLLLTVFMLKAAMLPMYFWLPRAYAAAPAAVAALFTVMTKVGIYAILRVFTLIFGEKANHLANISLPWLWWGGLATLVLAGIGVLSARDLRTQVCYMILISVGTLLIALGMHHESSIAALLYYTIHTTLITGGLFLLADVIDDQRGKAGARIVKSRPVLQPTRLGLLYFIGMISVIGLPPLSGAIGKALILLSAEASERAWLWPTLLISSLCGIVAAARAGSTVFWHTSAGEPSGTPMGKLRSIGVYSLIGSSIVLTVFAGPLTAYTQAAAEQLLSPERYIQSILIRDTEGDAL